MLEMPIRTGRKLQDAARQMREGVARRANERQQVNSLHRQRMTTADSLRPFSKTQDWTGGMSVSPSGRFRVMEETQPKQKAFSREGIRWDAAWIILVAVIVLCAAVLLADVAGMGLGSRSIGRLDIKIADMTRRNQELKAELEMNAGDTSVCTKAVDLNLIAGSGARTITLTAPEQAETGITEAGNAVTGRMAGSAAE